MLRWCNPKTAQPDSAMIASRPSFLPLALAAALALPGIFLSSQASAQDLCDDNGALMQGARQAQIQRVAEIEQHARNVYGPMANSPSWLSDAQSDLANCIADKFQGWQSSTGNGLFDHFANEAIERAIDQACAEQRRRVAQYTSQGKGYLSRIPGYENVGSIQDAFTFVGGSGGMNYGDIMSGIRNAIPGGSNMTYDELLRRVRERIPGGSNMTNDQLVNLLRNGQVPTGVIDYNDLIGRLRGGSGSGSGSGGNQNPSPQPPPGNYGPAIPGVGPGNPGSGGSTPRDGNDPSPGIPGILP